jgi:hypothetical protein
MTRSSSVQHLVACGEVAAAGVSHGEVNALFEDHVLGTQ